MHRQLIRSIVAVAVAAAALVPTMNASAADGDNLPYRCTVAAHNDAAAPPTGPTIDRAPVIWTTKPMLQRARHRVAAGSEPFATTWQLTKAAADTALDSDFEPYQGPDRFLYFDTAIPQAQAARNLAIAWQITRDPRYLQKGRDLILAWAIDGQTNPYPGSDLPHAAGLAIGRSMAVFADAYALLFDAFSPPQRRTVKDWFANLVDPIMESARIWREGSLDNFDPPYLDQQYFNNHLSAQALGLAAIAFVTGDSGLAHWVLDDRANIRNLDCLINGAILMPGDYGSGGEGDVWVGDPTLTDGAPAPLPGEVYDRYRVVEGAGQVYVLEHLRLLTLIAEIAYNNGFGANWYDFVGSGGENLELSYDLYADFFIAGDEGSVNDGYYVHPRGLGVPWTYLSYYELVARHYPANDRITQALCNDHLPRTEPRPNESLGYSAALLYGPDLSC